jgi:aspartyl-tRNA(Asn)/glutamyl-tRNA(Gln) amidotransferase subunit C
MLDAHMGDQKKLSIETTEHIARLAHLELSKAELEKFTGQMNSILGNFAQLAEINVDNVEPTNHPMEVINVFREDKPLPSLSQEEALQNAPKKEEGFIKAPRIV